MGTNSQSRPTIFRLPELEEGPRSGQKAPSRGGAQLPRNSSPLRPLPVLVPAQAEPDFHGEDVRDKRIFTPSRGCRRVLPRILSPPQPCYQNFPTLQDNVGAFLQALKAQVKVDMVPSALSVPQPRGLASPLGAVGEIHGDSKEHTYQ